MKKYLIAVSAILASLLIISALVGAGQVSAQTPTATATATPAAGGTGATGATGATSPAPAKTGNAGLLSTSTEPSLAIMLTLAVVTVVLVGGSRVAVRRNR